MEEKMIDQGPVAETISEKIPYLFTDYFLVKPLDPIKVTKEFSTPVANTEEKKDDNGIVAKDYDEVKKELKEVDANYRKGVVLKVPFQYETAYDEEDHMKYFPRIQVGDVVVFRDAAGFNFDLLKDSKLLRQYDIVAIEK